MQFTSQDVLNLCMELGNSLYRLLDRHTDFMVENGVPQDKAEVYMDRYTEISQGYNYQVHINSKLRSVSEDENLRLSLSIDENISFVGKV